MNIKRIIQEEMDDLSWMDDISSDYVPQMGDKVEITNSGSKEPYNKWLGRYVRPYLDGGYGNKIRGTVIHTVKYSFTINEHKTDDDIQFPRYENGDFISSDQKNRHPGLKLSYKHLDNLNESDDLDWIREVSPNPLNTGDLIFISPIGTDAVNFFHYDNNDPKNYIILELSEITEKRVSYERIVTTLGNSRATVKLDTTDIKQAKKIIESGYWRILDPNIPRDVLTSRSEDILPYVIYDGNKRK